MSFKKSNYVGIKLLYDNRLSFEKQKPLEAMKVIVFKVRKHKNKANPGGYFAQVGKQVYSIDTIYTHCSVNSTGKICEKLSKGVSRWPQQCRPFTKLLRNI